MPIIKRYPNRKLYDTEAKRYVTLDSITQMIHDGQDVQVVDHETGEDLTNLTLSQIIFEQEKKGSGLLPRSLLTNLVRAGGDTLDQFRRALLGGAVASAGDPARPLEEGEEGSSSHLHKVDDLFQDLLTNLNVPTHRDLQRLQAQVDELNAKIAALLAAEQGTGRHGTGQQGTGRQGTGQQGTGRQGTGQQGTGQPTEPIKKRTRKTEPSAGPQ